MESETVAFFIILTLLGFVLVLFTARAISNALAHAATERLEPTDSEFADLGNHIADLNNLVKSGADEATVSYKVYTIQQLSTELSRRQGPLSTPVRLAKQLANLYTFHNKDKSKKTNLDDRTSELIEKYIPKENDYSERE